MKRMFSIAIALFLFPLIAHVETNDKKDPMMVEMIEGPTTRPYSLITPISSDKSSLEDAFADLRKKAAKMNADAVIEWQCDKGQKSRGGGLIGIGHKVTIKAGCEGKAVKWTGEAPVAVVESKPAPSKESKKK